MASENDLALWKLFREYPADAAVFTFGPLLVAVALMGNAAVHDLSLIYPATFAAALAAYSVLVTQHRLARARLSRLQPAWTGVESSAD
jgi:hypothetical protein